MHEVAGMRVRVALFAAALGLVALVTCLAAAFRGKEYEPELRRIVMLNGSTMANFFQEGSKASKAFVLLTAKGSGDTGFGPIMWDMELEMNVQLDQNKTHIYLKEEGFYLVFVQMTFKVPTAQIIGLDLRVKLNYMEGEDDMVAAHHTHCANLSKGEEEIDAVLNQPVLLKLTKGDSFSVFASPRELIDYELRPAPSFLTLVKISNLKEGMRREAVEQNEGDDGM